MIIIVVVINILGKESLFNTQKERTAENLFLRGDFHLIFDVDISHTLIHHTLPPCTSHFQFDPVSFSGQARQY